MHYETGAYEDARALTERALVIQEKAFGAEHTGIAANLSLLDEPRGPRGGAQGVR